MDKFTRFKRKEVAELRPVTAEDLEQYSQRRLIVAHETTDNVIDVSISSQDRGNGSPKLGDMIARNPKNHLDQWLVSKQYFEDNFENA